MFKTKQFFDHSEVEFSKSIKYERIIKEQKDGVSGYYDLPISQDGLMEQIKNYKNEHMDFLYSCESIVVVGIGGSSLGSKAIHNALKYKKRTKKLVFLESSDPLKINMELEKIDLKKSIFIVISKSGSTIETISLFKYILFLHGATSPKEINEKLIFITDKGSALDSLGTENGVKTFTIDKNVGGRFSVLSAVGLVPLALAGYDVKTILDGAKELYNDFIINKIDKHQLLKKASFYATNYEKISNNVLFSYSSLLKDFNAWYVQLWGESLGKVDKNGKRKGLTPIGIIGPVDQHSFLQLIMEGPRDKSVTFIKITDFHDEIKIPNISLKGLESLDFVNNESFETLINKQCDATMESLKSVGVPVDLIEFDGLDEKNIGYIIYYFELLTSLVGAGFDINTYDQPGVELGKKILREKFNGAK
ncbi:MAG: glucose-6-phosphate isomerase [Campylobacterota bacterium]|nr:glucose-6-phosphate isomerase [Campylobacterota bacterium]